ncbi:MAG: HD domain-containing protein [Bacteroidota bacterium]
MNYLSIDYLIIGAFLLITLIIGLWAGRGIKDIREYAIANKQFGTAALIATFLATDIAGESVLDLTGEVGKTGIILSVVFIVGVGIAFIIQALFIAPKMVYFDKCITMGDVMGTLYGANSKIITGLLGFFTAICIAGMEVTVLGLLCESLLDIDYRWGVGLGGLILAVYSAYGGIKAVTVTDIFQLLTLLIVMPMIVVIALQHAGGINTIFTQVPTEKLQIIHHPNFSYYLTLFLFKVIFHFYMIDPALMQRLLMGKSQRQLRNQFLTLSVFSPVLYLALMLLGLAGLVLYPSLAGTQVVPQIINDLLPVGLKGLAITGLLAVTMSTVDSFLHATGITFVHDIVKPLCDKGNLTINELRWVKWATVYVSLFAIAIGFAKADNLYGLLFTSIEFTGPLLAFPLFGGILGLKPDKQAFYIASGVTVGAFLLTKFLLPAVQSYFSVLISVVSNGIVFLGIHALHNKGFSIVNRTEEVDYLNDRTKDPIAKLKECISMPWRIASYSQRRVAKYGAPYMLFGLVFAAYYIIPAFIWEHREPTIWELILYLRLIGALACGLLLVKDIWPKYLLPYLPAFWHLTLLYCLPFTSTLMLLLTQGSVEWLINVAITIMFLIVLVDWVGFLLLTALGVGLACLFYTQVVGPTNLQLDFSTSYLLFYQGIFATLIGLLLACRKQKIFDTLARRTEALTIDNQITKKELLEATEDRIRLSKVLKKARVEDLVGIAQQSKELLETSKLDSPEAITRSLEQLYKRLSATAIHVDKLDHRATYYLKLEDVKTLSLEQLLQAVQERLEAKGLSKGIKLKKATQHQELQCDEAKIQHLLVNSISFIRAVGGEEVPVLLALEDTQLGYRLNSVTPGYTKQVAALRITITTEETPPTLKECYLAQMNEDTYSMPETTIDLPLIANERILKAHYGYSSTISDSKAFTQLYIIPVKLREVRPKDMDLPAMELGAELTRADDTYPGAQEQEAAFLQAVQEHTQADLELVRKSIELIKQYHGSARRQSGEPFYLHPLAVAHIVLDYNQDEATVLGALLHDIVEDTALTIDQVEIRFNKEVRNIVDGVTHLDSYKGTFYKVKLSPHENIRMLLEVVDKRALYVKIADRTHNMRTIQHKPYESQRRAAEETLLFFVPLAEKLELYKAAQELKERSFEVLTKI